MLAKVVDAAGSFRGLHRTFLRPDGSGKADADPSRATLGRIDGGAIRLDPLAPGMVVGEGIESSASAGRLLGLPAWAAVSAGNLARSLTLPLEVLSIVIAVDADPAGRRAANEAARRWQREGQTVRLMIPDGEGADANDVLRKRLAAAARHG
jgi:hypothetical protein